MDQCGFAEAFVSAGFRCGARLERVASLIDRIPLEAGLGDVLFAEVSRQLEAGGFMVKTGTLVNESLVEAAVRRGPDGSCPRAWES